MLDIFHIHDFFYDTKQNVKSLCIHFRYCPKQSKECITYAPQTQFQPKKTIDRINIHDYFLVRPKKCELFYIHVHTLPILMGSLYQQSSIYYKAPNKENFNLNIKFAHLQIPYTYNQPAKTKWENLHVLQNLVHPGLTQTHFAARTFKGDAELIGNHSGSLGGSWEGRVTDLDWIHRHTHLVELLHMHSITGLSHHRTSNPNNPKHWYANPVPSGAARRQRAPARIPAVPARTPASCRSPGGSTPRWHQLKLWAGTCNFWSGEFEERTRLLPAGMEDSYQRWDY